MSVAIVDRLEPVDVDKQQGEFRTRTFCVEYGLLKPVAKQNAIGEIGEGAMLGEIDDVLLGFLSLRDISKNHGYPVDVAGVIAQGGALVFNGKAGIVPAPEYVILDMAVLAI